MASPGRGATGSSSWRSCSFLGGFPLAGLRPLTAATGEAKQVSDTDSINLDKGGILESGFSGCLRSSWCLKAPIPILFRRWELDPWFLDPGKSQHKKPHLPSACCQKGPESSLARPTAGTGASLYWHRDWPTPSGRGRGNTLGLHCFCGSGERKVD